MKRAYTDIRDDDRRSHTFKRRYEGSPLSNSSPAWSSSSVSPAYRSSQNHSKNQRQFKGCSKITDYEFLDKLGEGTFGLVFA